MTKFTLVYEDPRQVTDWQRRHAEGLVPGAWLYGLNNLSEDSRVTSLDVTYADSWTAFRRAAAVARVAAPSTKPPRHPGQELTLAWDERNALKTIGSNRSNGSLWSGLIWATDYRGRRGHWGGDQVYRRALRKLAGLWVLSTGQLGTAEDYARTDQPVRYVRFGIDHKFFSPVERSVQDRPLLLSLGNDKDRDTATLYRALSRVHAADPSIDIRVQTNSNLSPPNGVVKVPRMSHVQLRELYRRASAVVLPTVQNLHFSGMTAALEAMACGAVPIVTATPGHADYVTHGRTGLAVAPQDDAGFASAALSVASDPELSTRMGDAARREVELNYTHHHLSRSIVDAVMGVSK